MSSLLAPTISSSKPLPPPSDDNPDGWATDLRIWLIGDGENYNHNRALCGGKVGKTGFLPNIARMFYGLYENPCIGFNELNIRKLERSSFCLN